MPSSADDQLSDVFGAPVADLYERAVGADAPAGLDRALQVRSFLALAEEQVARVRDRVYSAMDPERDMGELSADNLRMDAEWLQVALEARDSYRTALDGLLLTLPSPRVPARPVHLAQPTMTASLPPASLTPQRAGTGRARRP
ncbi:hypothetical protein J8N05_45665 [Streptomyces sp. BH-SS-21]|uniref:Uncharacterized protein n=1 Tax=Streptomyces liliiviolaceus TaxID=2823109 RepID=A0A941B9A6_9ACTN|nr:hypothetical protein [Streptomyces liliiviolaceus]MBQ0855460.1 hypothetical protein [Streptomyces liliiviolaceus]